MIQIQPITRTLLGNVNRRCLPDGGNLEHCLASQGAVGIGAWDGALFVGSLWFYRLDDHLLNPYNPPWGGYNPAHARGLRERKIRSNLRSGPFLGLDCFHVGRLIANGPAAAPDQRYLGRGIGTSLLQAAIAYAKEEGYAAVLGGGGADRIRSYNHWAGALPTRVFLRHGFRCTGTRPFVMDGARQIDCPPEIYDEMSNADVDQDGITEVVLDIT